MFSLASGNLVSACRHLLQQMLYSCPSSIHFLQESLDSLQQPCTAQGAHLYTTVKGTITQGFVIAVPAAHPGHGTDALRASSALLATASMPSAPLLPGCMLTVAVAVACFSCGTVLQLSGRPDDVMLGSNTLAYCVDRRLQLHTWCGEGTRSASMHVVHGHPRMPTVGHMLQHAFTHPCAQPSYQNWALQSSKSSAAVIEGTCHDQLNVSCWWCAGNSGFSWSDVLLGDMPNIYVYACNNPSETIVAKRRGYGTIVSHNVPPYGRCTPANTYFPEALWPYTRVRLLAMPLSHKSGLHFASLTVLSATCN